MRSRKRYVLTAAAFRLEWPEPERFDHRGRVARMTTPAPQVRRAGRDGWYSPRRRCTVPACGDLPIMIIMEN